MAQSESSPFPYSVTDALFIPAEGNRVELVVIGRGFARRAVPLAAQVGAQPVEGIEIRSDGTSFSGRLQRAPSPGDRLALGYLDEELRPTAIVYRGPERPIA
ncbi:MAG: hypothetical protein ABJC89_17440 [Acidobacteriota bacterium]